MQVNFNTQNFGYTNANKAKNPAFCATIKKGTLVKTAGEIQEIIGHEQSKTFITKLDDYKSKIAGIKADGKNFEIAFGLDTSTAKSISGREYTQLLPSASSYVGEEYVVAKSELPIDSIDFHSGSNLANRLLEMASALASKIEGCNTRIKEKAQTLEEAINSASK